MTELGSIIRPPSPTNRLFFGGLCDSITDNALVSLLKPFGEVTKMDRHLSGFAHLTLQTESNNIDRCLRTLNRTRWRGTTIRVERAREHFLHRLQQEQTGENTGHGTDKDEPSALDESEEDKSESSVHASFRFSWKGHHVEFPEYDGPSSEEDEPVNNTHINRGVDKTNYEDRAKTSKPSSPKLKKRSSAVTSTLQLFGLQDIAGPSGKIEPIRNVSTLDETAEKQNGDAVLKRGRLIDLEDSNSDPKRKKKMKSNCETQFVGMDISKACAVEEDDTLIDLPSERAAALAILSNMFSLNEFTHHSTTERKDAYLHDSYQRLGLFRKLTLSPSLQLVLGENWIPETSAGHSSESESQFRRKGLYRELLAQ